MTNKTQLRVIQMANGGVPYFKESFSSDWISFGEDNLYPQFLDELSYSSSIHNAILNGTTDMIYAGGLDSTEKETHQEQYLKLIALFDNANLKRVAGDLKRYGNAYINTIWSADRTFISEVYHVPASCVRVGGMNEANCIEKFYYSTNWQKGNSANVQVIPAFDLSDRTAASQLLHIKLYNPISTHYGLPDYIGAINYIELDKDISEFHLSNLKNGFFPSMHIAFNNGEPTDEEARLTEQMVYDKFGGGGNAGKILMSWNNSADDAPKIEPIDLQQPHEMYSYLSEQVDIKILSGHRVTSPLLFGIRNEGGGFGNNADEMRDAFDLYNTTVVQGFQDLILASIRPLMAANGITIPVSFKEYIPASFLKKTESSQSHFSKQIPNKIDDNSSKFWLSKLEYKHAPITDQYKLWKSEPVTNNSFEYRLNKRWNFADSINTLESYDNHDLYSEWGDVISPKGYHFKLRYAYSQNDSTTESKTGKSREFCQNMVDLSKGGVMYRFEDITDMSDDGINGQFAAKGSSTYDIFEWVGGKNCYHYWERRIFVAAPNGELITDEDYEVLPYEWDEVMRRVGNNPYVPQKGEESVPPIKKQ